MEQVTVSDLETQHPFEIMRRYEAYYKCPKDTSGKRLGPLAGYAGEYEPGKFYVGDEYANYARIEQKALPHIYYCNQLLRELKSWNLLEGITGLCGLPEGGKSIAGTLQVLTGLDVIYPEKKITALKTATSREISQLQFGRHEPESGTRWILIEDVVNNFSSADKNVQLFEERNAEVVAIACFLDRSLREVRSSYTLKNGKTLPVVAVVDQPIPQYRQDDPAVIDDIRAGNVVWKPKNEWDKLAAAMRATSSS